MDDTGSPNLPTLSVLTGDNRRWCFYGIALNHVVVLSIRPILEQRILKEYNELQLKHRIDVQTSHSFPVPKYSKRNAMKYENINGNDTKSKILFDYKVSSHVDFAKLFLQNYMAKFNAFNETCDASAVLILLGKIPVFHTALQMSANTVREGRNAWGHCNLTEWNEVNFTKRFGELKQLVKEVGLSPTDESKVLADLKDWEDKGVGLCMNTDVDSKLVRDVRDHVNRLLSNVGNMAFQSKGEMNNVMAMLNNIQIDFEKRLHEIEHKQYILQREQDNLQRGQEILQCGQDNLQRKQDNIHRAQVILEKRVANVEQEGQNDGRFYDAKQLTKCNFKGNIKKYNALFHPETRKWLSKKVDRWFEREVSNSQVMILTADAGYGKSTFAAHVCEEYIRRGQLAACYFFKSGYSDYSDPYKMLQSLASHLCDSVNGFAEKLAEQLQRNYSTATIGDAFRVLLKDPLNSLPDQESSILIVIDGLDESVSSEKKQLLEVIEEEFQMLPKWVKIFITSRPELTTKKKLEYLNHVEILQDDKHNQDDLRRYLTFCVKDRHDVNEIMLLMNAMVNKCQGSFLYAYYYQLELRKLKSVENVLNVVPRGIEFIYKKYFERLEEELKNVSTKIEFDRILEILVAMENPFPLSLIPKILELSESTRNMRVVISNVNECISALLPVDNDCVTVFHKTVVDWLDKEGERRSKSDILSYWQRAHKTLWQACQQMFVQLEINGPKEAEEAAEQYALKYGLNHLAAITFGRIIPGSVAVTFPYRTAGDIIHLRKGKEFFGCGWLVFKDNEIVYVMTSNYSVLRLIECCHIDNFLEIWVFHGEDKPAKYDAIVTKNDSVVVSSIENSALDYAVLRVKTSKIVEALPIQVSKKSVEPGDWIIVPWQDESSVPSHVGDEWHVEQYPGDLIDWLKKSSSSSSSSSSLIPGCDPSINFNNNAEDLKDILIPYCYRSVAPQNTTRFMPGRPIFTFKYSDDGQVAAMCSRQVFIYCGKEKKHFVTLGVSMPKIIDDIHRKKREEAKKWFPNYFD